MLRASLGFCGERREGGLGRAFVGRKGGGCCAGIRGRVAIGARFCGGECLEEDLGGARGLRAPFSWLLWEDELGVGARHLYRGREFNVYVL